jgi:hypothetical protein
MTKTDIFGISKQKCHRNLSLNPARLIEKVENLFIKETEFHLFTISYGVILYTGSGFL